MVHNSSTRYQSLLKNIKDLSFIVLIHFFFLLTINRVGRMRILPIYTIRLVMDLHSLLTIPSILTSLALILLSSLLPNNTTLFLLTRMSHRLLLPLFPMQLTLISSPVARLTLRWRLVQQLTGVGLTGEDPGTEMLQQLMGRRGMPLQLILLADPPRSHGLTLEDRTDQ